MFIQREEKKTHQNKPVKIINLAWGTKVQCYCLIFLFVVRCLENRKQCFDFTLQYFYFSFHSFVYEVNQNLWLQGLQSMDEGWRQGHNISSVCHTSKKYHYVLHHSSHISEILSITIKTLSPPKKKSHIFFLHISCETPTKSNQKWVLCSSQKTPLFSDKNKDYRITLSIFQRRNILGSFLGFSLNYIYILLCW